MLNNNQTIHKSKLANIGIPIVSSLKLHSKDELYADACTFRPPALCLAPGPVPDPQFAFTGPGPQFVFTVP